MIGLRLDLSALDLFCMIVGLRRIVQIAPVRPNHSVDDDVITSDNGELPVRGTSAMATAETIDKSCASSRSTGASGALVISAATAKADDHNNVSGSKAIILQRNASPLIGTASITIDSDPSDSENDSSQRSIYLQKKVAKKSQEALL